MAIAQKEGVRPKQSELVGATKTDEVAALIISGMSCCEAVFLYSSGDGI